MKKQEEKVENVQGTETTEKNQENKETTVYFGEKAERKVQMPLTMLKELMEDKELSKAFIKIVMEEPELKTPMIYQMAKREVKQLKMEV